MSKLCGVWIDGKKAILVNLDKGTEHVSEISAGIDNRVHHINEGDKGSFMGRRHINNQKKFDERRRHQSNAFLNQVLEELKKVDAILLMGPAGMKTRLRTRIADDREQLPKLMDVQSADSMTEPQLKARVREFFLSNN